MLLYRRHWLLLELCSWEAVAAVDLEQDLEQDPAVVAFVFDLQKIVLAAAMRKRPEAS